MKPGVGLIDRGNAIAVMLSTFSSTSDVSHIYALRVTRTTSWTTVAPVPLSVRGTSTFGEGEPRVDFVILRVFFALSWHEVEAS